MEWEEQKSSTRFVVMDEYRKQKKDGTPLDESQQYLMKPEDTLYCIVGLIQESTHPKMKGKKYVMLDLADKDGKLLGEQVSFTPTRYAEVAFGWDEDFPQSRKVETGDYIALTYHGRDKNKPKEPYVFTVAFGKK